MKDLTAIMRKLIDILGLRKSNKGLTLVEVLVGSFVLTVSLLGMARLTAGVMKGNHLSNKVTTATTLAQEKMEDMVRLGYASTPVADTTTTENYNSIPSYPIFKRVTSTTVDNPGQKMKTVTVTVYWDSDVRSVALPVILTQ